MKPKSAGRLAYITKQSDIDQAPTMIMDPDEMDDVLLEYSRDHFAKAEGSPFTTEPLNCLLAYDGLTPYGDKVTAGRPAIHHHQLDEPTQAILSNL